MSNSIIRPYGPGDAVYLSAIFFEAVRKEGIRDYSPAQVAAWASATPDPAKIDAAARDGRLLLVAVDADDKPVAYGDLEPNGHIDHLYCRPDLIGLGIGSAIYDGLERHAREHGMSKLSVEASQAARTFFLKKGFVELRRNGFRFCGVPIYNYIMEQPLRPFS